MLPFYTPCRHQKTRGYILGASPKSGLKTKLYIFLKKHSNPINQEVPIMYKPIQWFANQWTGFYMIGISIMKELKCKQVSAN